MVKQDYVKGKNAQYSFLADTLAAFYAHSAEETLEELISPTVVECVKTISTGSNEIRPVAIALISEIWVLDPQILLDHT